MAEIDRQFMDMPTLGSRRMAAVLRRLQVFRSVGNGADFTGRLQAERHSVLANIGADYGLDRRGYACHGVFLGFGLSAGISGPNNSTSDEAGPDRGS